MKKRIASVVLLLCFVLGLGLTFTPKETKADLPDKKKVWITNPMGTDPPCVIISWYNPGCAISL